MTLTTAHVAKLRQLIEAAQTRRMDVGVTPTVLAALLDERDELLMAIDQAHDWLGLFGEHSPIAFGGESELADRLWGILERAQP